MHEIEYLTRRSGWLILMSHTKKGVCILLMRFLLSDLSIKEEEKMPRKLVKPAHDDPNNSVDLFDADRRNEFGEMYCVAPAILHQQVNNYWIGYLKNKDLDLEIY